MENTLIIEEIKEIKKDLNILTKLYSRFIDRILPEEEPEEEDLKAIESEDEIINEKELLKALK
jgi:hypothetical protein